MCEQRKLVMCIEGKKECAVWVSMYSSNAFGLFSAPQWLGFIGGFLNNKGCALQMFVWASVLFFLI